jgi:hypothetical protein
VQCAVLSSRVTHYKSIAHVNQSDFEFDIPGDTETYVNLNIHMSVRGKLVVQYGCIMDQADTTTVVNNLLHSLFNKWRLIIQEILHLQGVPRGATYLRARRFVESSHQRVLVSRRWGFSDPQPDRRRHEPRVQFFWKPTNSAEIEMYGRVHGDLFNVPRLLLPSVQLHIMFTKSKDVYIPSPKSENGASFKFRNATLHVRNVKPSPNIQLAHAKALENVNTRYDMTSVAFKTTYGEGSKFVSIDNAVQGTLSKRLLFTMLRNTDVTGSPHTHPYLFKHFKLRRPFLCRCRNWYRSRWPFPIFGLDMCTFLNKPRSSHRRRSLR